MDEIALAQSSNHYDDKTAEEVYEIAAKFLDYTKKLLESLESRND